MECPKCHSGNPETVKFCGECGTQLPPSIKEVHPEATETLQTPIHELTTGSTFAGRYQIIEELGKGGMGRVYRVLDKKLDEEVVLKLIKSEIGLDKTTVERFSNELKLSRKIVHKNVARMFDLNEEKGTHYITMEYVRGEDLRRLIRKMGMLSPGQAMPIARQVCEGLAEAHHLGVVHRDLKPSNIMIDEEGNARIMDFGIARSLRDKGMTGAGVMIGTPEYMSPEQVEGKEADQRSDIYSLGIILYEMATGKVPFEGDAALSIAVKHKTEIPKDPRELNPQIPEELSRLILRCMEKEKGRRYQRVDEILSALVAMESGAPASDVIAAKVPDTEKTPGAGWKKSIAVLPFSNLSPEKEQEYFCDGLSEEIINALSHVRELRVVARTSAFAFKGKEVDVREVGEKLNVDAVLEGSVRKAGDRLRITAQLINVADGYHLWSERFDRGMKDIFDIQDEVTLEIIGKLKIELLGKEKEQIVRHSTDNMDAYKFYLEGLYYWNKRTGKDLRKAAELFSQAIDKDPNYAMAYVGLADSYNLLPIYGDARPLDAFPRAKAAATKALEINETLAEAHNSLAYVYERYDWNWKNAEAEFKRALELNPNYATGHFWYGELFMYLGRSEESIREMKRALELDPVSLIINTILSQAYLWAQQPDQALAQLHETLELDPNFPLTHHFLGNAYLAKHQFSEAIMELKKARELSGDAVMEVGTLGVAYGRAGKIEEARGILEELKARSQKQYISSYWIGCVFGAIGDVDKLFELWSKAYEERTEWLIFIKSDPSLVPYRSDPRHKALLRKMGFE
jgi:serine/threonine protein kinase/tetratricopeptide (TPR) repeat protein